MTAQTCSSEVYAKDARFVTDLGTPVPELLAPRPGEHILDVGCGDGILTKKTADLGCSEVGVDSSAGFVASARQLRVLTIDGSAALSGHAEAGCVIPVLGDALQKFTMICDLPPPQIV